MEEKKSLRLSPYDIWIQLHPHQPPVRTAWSCWNRRIPVAPGEELLDRSDHVDDPQWQQTKAYVNELFTAQQNDQLDQFIQFGY